MTNVAPPRCAAHWQEDFLHNQTALRLTLRLFRHKNTIVADVPTTGWNEWGNLAVGIARLHHVDVSAKEGSPTPCPVADVCTQCTFGGSAGAHDSYSLADAYTCRNPGRLLLRCVHVMHVDGGPAIGR